MSIIYEMLEDRLRLPKDTKTSFAGRTVIVTGSNVGLGFEAAVKFVQSGASRVILGVRTLSKGDKAKEQIESRTGCGKDIVYVWHLDMLDYESLKTFTKKAETESEHLDIVCLNAGLMSKEFRLSPYGWETTLQLVNTLWTAQLAILLLPKMISSKMTEFTPVLEIVSSDNHRHVGIRKEARTADSALDVYNAAAGYNALGRYGISKLFIKYVQTALVKHLGQDCGKPPVSIVTVCPGPVATEIIRDLRQWYMIPLIFLTNNLVCKTPEQGARTYISGVALGEKGHVEFFTRDQIQKPADNLVGAENEKFQEKVWQNVVKALRKDVPEVNRLPRLLTK